MNYPVTNYFAFSYGGNRNFGEVHPVNTPEYINFPEEQPDGYGFTIRHKHEAKLNKYTGIQWTVNSDSALVITVERPNKSGSNATNANYDVHINPGENIFEVPHPIGTTKSKLFISKIKNPDLQKTEFRITNIEMIKQISKLAFV